MKCVREISVVWGVVCRILTRGRVVLETEKGVVGSVIGSGEGDSIRRVGIYRRRMGGRVSISVWVLV